MSIADDLVSAIEQLSGAQQALSESLAPYAGDRTTFQSSKTIPNTHQSLAELDSELTTITQSIKGIAAQDLTLVPFNALDSSLKKITKIIGHYSDANTKVRTGDPIRSITPEEYTFSDKDGNSQNIARDLEAASDTTEDLLADWHILRLAAKSPRINDFAAFLRLNSKQREHTEQSYREVEEIKLKAEALDSAIATIHSEANEANEEIDRLKTLIGSDRKNITEFVSEASVKIESIRKTSSDADALRTTISEYQTEFDRFNNQLDERTRRINEGNNDISRLVERLSEQENTIKQIISQSEAMLVGATNAGLAGSLSKRLIEITKEVGRARIAYYLSIAILICATIPIAIDIVPREILQNILKTVSNGYIDVGGSSQTIKNPDLLGHILAKALLLIPPFLLVRFAAARHERLFRLREHYAYKYSIASSVEGFKQQSPEEYRDYIALVAFNELTFNPATQMEAKGTETKHPSPIIEAFLRKTGLAPEQQ